MEKKNKERIWVHMIIVVLCVVMIVPFLAVVSTSLSTNDDIAKYGYSIIPRHLTLSA